MSALDTVLVTDLGGTKLYGGIARRDGDRFIIRETASVLIAGVPTLPELIRRLCGKQGLDVDPKSFDAFSIGAAGRLVNGAFIHPPYSGPMSVNDCCAEFGWKQAVKANDGEALTWAVDPAVGVEVETIIGVPQDRWLSQNRGAIGPGTGLARGFYFAGPPPFVLRTEGGHAGLSVLNPRRQLPFLEFVASRLQTGEALRREVVYSGRGLALAHEFVTGKAVPEFDVPGVLHPDAAGLYAYWLGIEIRDVVMNCFGDAGPGAFYLAGGVLGRNPKILLRPELAEGMRAGETHAAVIDAIAVFHITDPNAQLKGALAKLLAELRPVSN